MSASIALAVLWTTGTAAPRQAAEFCGGEPGSRWSTAGGNYRQTGSFGRGSQEWLAGAVGLAFSGTHVVVHDITEPRVRILDTGLRPVRSFGRRGGAPGEFAQSMTVAGRDPYWLYTRKRNRCG